MNQHVKHILRPPLLACTVLLSVWFCQTLAAAQLSHQKQDSVYSWTRAATPPWPARCRHFAAIYNNKIWIAGGSGMNDTYLNDVWSSEDGINWTCATEHAEWEPRCDTDMVMFEDKLWILGGYTESLGDNNAVWYSVDGAIWIQATPEVIWPERSGHASAVFSDKLWVLGGIFEFNDVWSSDNGLTWVLNSEHAPWSTRSKFSAASFKQGLWILGGSHYDGAGGSHDLNDIWYTWDGVTWIQVCLEAPWHGRRGHTTVVYDNKLWVLGGIYNVGSGHYGHAVLLNDVWFSLEGVDWTEVNTVPWEPRVAHASVVFDGKLWVLGGHSYSAEPRNDIWYMSINTSEGEGEGAPAEGSTEEGEGCSGPCHSADQNRDGRIDLSELLRVIQFFFIGAYHCDPSGEDGYAPGPGDTSCIPHNSDYDPQDWTINLTELLRLIQFFNSSGYQSCTSSEDGFCLNG